MPPWFEPPVPIIITWPTELPTMVLTLILERMNEIAQLGLAELHRFPLPYEEEIIPLRKN